MVHGFYDIQIMFYNKHCISLFYKLLKDLKKLFYVIKVQTCCWLI